MPFFPSHPISFESEMIKEVCYTLLKKRYSPEALPVVLYTLNMFFEVLRTHTVSDV